MSIAVVDASVVLRWAFEDEADRDGAVQLERAIESGLVDVTCPPNFLLEVCATLAVGIRIGRITRAAADLVLAGLAKVAISESEPHGFAISAFELSLDHGVRVPDAAYVEVARRTGGTLVSADHAQLEAAARLGLTAVAIAALPAWVPDTS